MQTEEATAQPQQVEVVVFDFDDTSIEGSSPSWLVNKLIFGLKLTPLTSLKIGFWGLAYKLRLPQNEAWVRGQVFKAFAGKPREEVDQYLRNFYDKTIEPRFRPMAHKTMQEHADAGRTVIVVSASFEPIVMRAMELHPFVGQVSTRMKVDENGCYTREVDGKPVEGDEKLEAISRWCDEHFGEGGWKIVAAYGDHHSDEPMLASAERAYAVTPDNALERIAIKRGWPILDWHMDVHAKK